jgi:hypothetical protein
MKANSATEISKHRAVAMLRAASVTIVSVVVSGCMSYQPQQLAAKSDYELCETAAVQRVNLSQAGRAQLASELSRRNADCSAHAPAIRANAEWDLFERTYFNQSP